MVSASSIVIFFISLNWFAPGQLFMPLIIIFAVVILPAAFILSPKLLYAIQFILKKDPTTKKIGFSWRFFSIYCIVALPIFVALVAWDSLSPTTYTSTKIYDNLPSAYEDFIVQPMGDISAFQRDRAYSVFEQYYSELRATYLPPLAKQQPITIKLYPTFADLNNASSLPFLVGGTFTFEKDELVIRVQADITHSYKHELMHAVTGQALGLTKSVSLPRWFCESLSISVEGREPMSNYPDAKDLWPNRSSFRSFEQYQALLDDDIALFSAGSRQLHRYLILRFGEQTISNVFTNMNNGSSFDLAFETATSLSPEKFYDSWTKWYFN
jgi:hypothetical protein